MKKILYMLGLLALPSFAFAFSNLTEVVDFFTNFIGRSVVSLFVVLAIAYFIWGIVRFIKDSDDETEREKGRQAMLWGIIALFVLTSYLGIISILGGTFGIGIQFPGVVPRGTSGGTQPNYDFQPDRTGGTPSAPSPTRPTSPTEPVLDKNGVCSSPFPGACDAYPPLQGP
ncbi:pilin [Candidatus Parcubacteria bacterium]|nr:pilin [Candidatus Parcubacteria bacterium]